MSADKATAIVVVLVLAGLWIVMLAPAVTRRRRRPSTVNVGPNDVLEIRERWSDLYLGLAAALALAVFCFVMGFATDAVAARIGYFAAGMGLLLLTGRAVMRKRSRVPLIRFDSTGITLRSRGTLPWTAVDGAAVYKIAGQPQLAIVSASGVAPKGGRLAGAFGSLDRLYTGLPVWSTLRLDARTTDETLRMFAMLDAHHVPRLSLRPGGVARIIRALLWFLP